LFAMCAKHACENSTRVAQYPTATIATIPDPSTLVVPILRICRVIAQLAVAPREPLTLMYQVRVEARLCHVFSAAPLHVPVCGIAITSKFDIATLGLNQSPKSSCADVPLWLRFKSPPLVIQNCAVAPPGAPTLKL